MKLTMSFTINKETYVNKSKMREDLSTNGVTGNNAYGHTQRYVCVQPA
jgi:hypothetical protein